MNPADHRPAIYDGVTPVSQIEQLIGGEASLSVVSRSRDERGRHAMPILIRPSSDGLRYPWVFSSSTRGNPTSCSARLEWSSSSGLGKLLRAVGKSDSVRVNHFTWRPMDPRKLAALARKNAAKSGTTSKIPKLFGKKYDTNLSDDPTDEATIKKQAENERFFAEMKKRDF